jgi:hypothetical protein
MCCSWKRLRCPLGNVRYPVPGSYQVRGSDFVFRGCTLTVRSSTLQLTSQRSLELSLLRACNSA